VQGDGFTYVLTTEQVTDTPPGVSHDQVTISHFADEVGFISNSNRTGANPEGNPEVFISACSGGFGAAACRAPEQMTVTDAASRQAHIRLATSGGGGVVFFQSTANLIAGGGNTGIPQSYLMEFTEPGRPVRQLTNNTVPGSLPGLDPAGHLSQAASSSLGEIIVFASNGHWDNLHPVGNRDGNYEIFFIDGLFDPNRVIQVTNTSAPVQNLHPAVDGFGTTVAFVSSGDLDEDQLDGIGNADGNFEVFTTSIEVTFTDPCAEPNPPPECFPPDPGLPPTIAPIGPQTVAEGVLLQVTVRASDPDVEFLSLGASVLGTAEDGSPVRQSLSTIGATFEQVTDEVCFSDGVCTEDELNQGTLKWRPGFLHARAAPYVIRFEARDLFGNAATLDVPVTVTDVNRAPTVSPAGLGTKTVKGDGTHPLTFQISGSDADCDTLSVVGASLPAGAALSTPEFTTCSGPGRASRLAATITWTPQAGDVRAEGHRIALTIQDGAGSQVTSEGSVTVVRNQLPAITTTRATVAEGACLSLTIQATDPDQDPLVYDVVAGTMPADGVFLRGTHAFHWHPLIDDLSPEDPETITVQFAVNDGMDTVVRDVTITVTDTPRANAAFAVISTTRLAGAPGQAVQFKLTVRNSGTTTWNPADNYALVTNYASPGLQAPAPIPLTQTVIPGNLATFTIALQAPTAPGTYYYRVRMSRDGQPFGDPSGLVVLTVQ